MQPAPNNTLFGGDAEHPSVGWSLVQHAAQLEREIAQRPGLAIPEDMRWFLAINAAACVWQTSVIYDAIETLALGPADDPGRADHPQPPPTSDATAGA